MKILILIQILIISFIQNIKDGARITTLVFFETFESKVINLIKKQLLHRYK